MFTALVGADECADDDMRPASALSVLVPGISPRGDTAESGVWAISELKRDLVEEVAADERGTAAGVDGAEECAFVLLLVRCICGAYDGCGNARKA